MTLFTLLGLGGMARADDRLWTIVKELCLEIRTSNLKEYKFELRLIKINQNS